jgi:hypothetical protein
MCANFLQMTLKKQKKSIKNTRQKTMQFVRLAPVRLRLSQHVLLRTSIALPCTSTAYLQQRYAFRDFFRIKFFIIGLLTQAFEFTIDLQRLLTAVAVRHCSADAGIFAHESVY